MTFDKIDFTFFFFFSWIELELRLIELKPKNFD